MTVIVDGRRVAAPGGVGATIEITEIESLAKGTIIVGDGSGAPAILAVGPTNQILQCDPSQPEGVSWTADPRVDTLGIGTAFPNATLEVLGNPGASVGGFPSGALHVTSPSALVNANSVITGHNLFGGNKQLWYLGSVSSSNDAIAFINRQFAALSLSTNSTTRLTVEAGGSVAIGTTSALGQLHVRQPSLDGVQPALYVEQEDVSEEMIEFDSTIGVGNAIEAVGAKTLTTTHFIKVTLPGGLTRYLPVGTIA